MVLFFSVYYGFSFAFLFSHATWAKGGRRVLNLVLAFWLNNIISIPSYVARLVKCMLS